MWSCRCSFSSPPLVTSFCSPSVHVDISPSSFSFRHFLSHLPFPPINLVYLSPAVSPSRPPIPSSTLPPSTLSLFTPPFILYSWRRFLFTLSSPLSSTLPPPLLLHLYLASTLSSHPPSPPCFPYSTSCLVPHPSSLPLLPSPSPSSSVIVHSCAAAPAHGGKYGNCRRDRTCADVPLVHGSARVFCARRVGVEDVITDDSSNDVDV